uniref:Uncharacterized protein n=1 Tax=Anguilla anguilla TaxID=7936 RepID=A0A0E9SWC0_ANGAN
MPGWQGQLKLATCYCVHTKGAEVCTRDEGPR